MALSFAIKYKGIFLDLEEDSFMTVDWFSTLFNEAEIFRGSYSYAVKLKLSEKNKGVLRMPHLIENRTSRVKYQVTILLFGQTWKNALLEVELVQDYISGNLLIDNSIIAEILRETTIPDLFSSIDSNGVKIFETIEIGNSFLERWDYINDTVNGEYPFVFPPFKNFGWDGDFGHGADRMINPYTAGFNQYALLTPSNLFSPTFFLHWLIINICDKVGFKAIGSFFEDEEMSRWVVFNNSYYTGNEILNPGFKIIPSRHFPNMTVGNFFKVLRNDFKIPIYFDSLKKTVTIELPQIYLENNDVVELGDNTILNSPKIRGGELKKFIIHRSKSQVDGVHQYFDSVDSLSLGSSEASTKVELSISSTKMGRYYVDRFNEITFRTPITDHLANIYDEALIESNAFNKEGEFNKNEFSFMILSYRGFVQCIQGEPLLKMPFATSDSRDALNEEHHDWISTDPMIENGWIRKSCQPFYQMLSLTEEVEFDTLLPIQKFLTINPLSKVRFRTKNGSISTLVLDKITFEPSNRNSLIYSKVKAFTINRSQLLFGVDLQFKVETKTNVPEVIYAFARFHRTRVEEGNPNGIDTYANLVIEFFNDKYKVVPKMVSNLEIKVEIHRDIRTSQSESTLIFERSYITGSNVYDFLSDEEFVISSTTVGGAFTSKIVLIDPESKAYVPGN